MSTGPIAYARADLATALSQATSLPVHASVPERLDPPCVVITEGTPLLEPATDQGHRAVTVRLVANIVEAPTDAALALARLDQHVDQTVTGLWNEYMATVDAYATVTGADGQRYLAATVNTTTTLIL